jgi:radical SAM superfamily enzyme YgiQ (UPF0313 family)
LIWLRSSVALPCGAGEVIALAIGIGVEKCTDELWSGVAPVRVGLVQINNGFSGQNYLPYSVACLQSYAAAHARQPARYRFEPLIYKRMPIRDVVAQLSGAEVVGFSTYVWNEQISLACARRLKERKPGVLIIFGGPQVPDQPENFLRANPFIDVAVHNEGERTFLQLLEAFPGKDWSDIDGISYIDRNGRYIRRANGPRMRDLGEVPSPFLNGLFDELMRANPHERWMAMWETNRGCPFQCTFCDWGSATAGKVNKFDLARLFAEIDWFSKSRIEFIFCCDANFGILPRDMDIARRIAEVKRATGYPLSLSVQNTKNATERAYETQKMLSDAGLGKGVALSMQSVDSRTLESIKRENISLETYLELQRRFARDGIETYSDLILGLPGETYESFADGVDTLITTGQHNQIRFGNLSILPNAEMANPAYMAKYGLTTVRSEMINVHGAREASDDDVPEFQQLVVATATMPPDDWRRTRVFAWMCAFLHFDKIMQFPLILAHELAGIPYRDIVEAFIDVERGDFPLLAQIADFFRAEAASIQQGGPEYVFSQPWLGIYWPADEYAFIKLTAENRFAEFYDQAGRFLTDLVAQRSPATPLAAVKDAVTINGALVSQPFVDGDITVTIDHDIIGFCRGIREGRPKPLERHPTNVEIRRSASCYADFNTWCREVVWFGNKKGAYLYNSRLVQVERQFAGHF